MRERTNFDREWEFQLGDPPQAAKWEAVNLPHSFSLPYFASQHFYTGYGWYRKHFTATAGKRTFLEFDGVFQDAEVFVNDRPVGRHHGGYTGFSIDVTDALKPGDNVVAVRANNLWNARLAPRAGEHVFSGGIYRDVWLVTTDPLHVTWYGTSVTTSGDAVNVKTEVRNDGSTRECELKTDILDPDGKLVASVTSSQSVTGTVVFDQQTKVAQPKLWHPDHPVMYRAVSTITGADRYETTFGFRSIEWTADRGFFLNGEHFYLLGANVHQDHAGWGDAVTAAGMERDVKLIKDAGFNFIRGSHYPHAPAFSDACDRLGMLFWSENAFWGIGGFQPDGYWNCSAYPPRAEDQPKFEASVKQQLTEMIRIHRNHPSIIAWSMSNEPFFTEDSQIPKMKAFLKDLVALTHKLDPTRPAAVGGVQRPLDKNRLDLIGDVAGQNGDGATIAIFQNPGVPSLVSEYGSTIADRPGQYAPGWGDLAKDSGQPVHPWRSGQAIWCGFDHGSIAGRKFGSMGLIDYFRLPKRQWYWYRNEYRKIPPPEWPGPGTPAGLQLVADKTTLTDIDDALIIVTVVDETGKHINNSPPVTLTIESGPGEFPTGNSITFDSHSDIAIRDGLAAIEMRTYYAGTTVIRATSPGLKDATLTIVSEGPTGGRPVTPRPYKRFEARKDEAVHSFGRQNPTRASSEAAGHNAGFANDGNPATSWRATDANSWWQVDLEKIVAVTEVKLKTTNAQYRVEVSEDGREGWKPVQATGRFVRVSFTGKSAEIADVKILGRLTP